MEIATDKINFKELFKVAKIDIDKITFRKYSIKRNAGIMSVSGFEMVDLDKEIGEETHVAKPEIVGELAGHVGLIIKGFEVQVIGKSKKKVILNKIIKLE